jgi:hypothetical protein
MVRMDRRGGTWKLLGSVVYAHRQVCYDPNELNDIIIIITQKIKKLNLAGRSCLLLYISDFWLSSSLLSLCTWPKKKPIRKSLVISPTPSGGEW